MTIMPFFTQDKSAAAELRTGRIKNVPKLKLQQDFHFNPFSFFILGLVLLAGFFVQQYTGSWVDTGIILPIAICVIAAGGILVVFPLWIVVIQLIIVSWILMAAFFSPGYYPLFLFISAGLLISSSTQLIYHWDKVIVLRLGKFRKVHGPGLFMLFPLLDRIAEFVDTRIRATDFSAEKTLTKDTVPVHVDALAFWMIWDAQKAILEVENYIEAVTLSAQAALRDSIGKHDLSILLSQREVLCDEIQTVLDEKTNPWGITILSVELTDIIIPQNLEDAMSKQAQAEREKESRIILGTAEVEIAKKFEEASAKYENNPTALRLRAMNMVYEGIRQKGSLVLLPASILESMDLGTVMGTAAMDKLEKMQDPEVSEDDNR